MCGYCPLSVGDNTQPYMVMCQLAPVIGSNDPHTHTTLPSVHVLLVSTLTTYSTHHAGSYMYTVHVESIVLPYNCTCIACT